MEKVSPYSMKSEYSILYGNREMNDVNKINFRKGQIALSIKIKCLTRMQKNIKSEIDDVSGYC